MLARTGLGDTYYQCSNESNPNKGIFRGSDYSHVPDMATFTREGGSLTNLATVACDLTTMRPAGAVQGALLSSGGSISTSLQYLASLPDWTLYAGIALVGYLAIKMLGHH